MVYKGTLGTYLCCQRKLSLKLSSFFDQFLVANCHFSKCKNKTKKAFKFYLPLAIFA